MKENTISNAERAAERFLAAVQRHNLRRERDPYYRKNFELTGFRETAAIRRASMDLTRALADMRKP